MKNIKINLQNYLKLKKRAVMVVIYMYDADSTRRETKENTFKYATAYLGNRHGDGTGAV